MCKNKRERGTEGFEARMDNLLDIIRQRDELDTEIRRLRGQLAGGGPLGGRAAISPPPSVDVTPILPRMFTHEQQQGGNDSNTSSSGFWMEELHQLRGRVERLELESALRKRDLEDASQPVVKLNVGGTVFQTLRTTLQTHPQSMLAALVSGRHQVARDSQGIIFVDRDPRCFGAILMFLRGEEPLPLHDEDMRRKFANDCDYYGLPRPEAPLVVSGVRLARTLHARTNLWAMDARGDLIVAGNKLFRISGTYIGELQGHTAPVLCTKISAALDLIATGSEDTTVRLWSVKTLECIQVLVGHTMSVCALDLADGVVCSASADWAIRVWKLENGEFLRVLHATEPVFCVRIDGDLIICGGEKAIHVWSRSKYRLQKTFPAHTKPTTNIAVLGPYAITSSNDRSVKVWQKLSWNCVRMHEYESEITAIDAAGDFLFCGDASGVVTIRSVTSGVLLTSIDTKKTSILSLVCLKESHLFVCGSMSGEVSIYELN